MGKYIKSIKPTNAVVVMALINSRRETAASLLKQGHTAVSAGNLMGLSPEKIRQLVK